ncbi:hypothetical protein KEM55_004302 [Ascosphaera atra]|nr:hypothetical protein KEM55_004302 [Ascosphaera atra]
MATSIHHSTHAKISAHGPQTPTHLNTNRLMIIDKLSGSIASVNDCVGCFSVCENFDGHRMYRVIDSNVNRTNRNVVRPSRTSTM